MANNQKQRMACLTQLYQRSIHSINQLAELTTYFTKTIKRHLPTLQSLGRVERKEYIRHSKLTPALMDVIEIWLEEDEYLTCQDIANRLFEEHQISVNRTTVGTRLWQHGIKYRYPTKKPMLTREHKERRVKWCEDYLNFH